MKSTWNFDGQTAIQDFPEVEETANELKLFKHIYQDLAGSITVGTRAVISIESEFPVGSGMGSSAAYAAALSLALTLVILHASGNLHNCARSDDGPFAQFGCQAKGIKDTEENLNALILRFTNFMERLNHGNPSGCDAATVITGGLIVFRKSMDGKESNKIDRLSTTRLEKGWFVVNTRQQKNTKDLVSRVRALKEQDPSKFEEIVGLIGDTTQSIIESLVEGEFNRDELLDYVC